MRKVIIIGMLFLLGLQANAKRVHLMALPTWYVKLCSALSCPPAPFPNYPWYPGTCANVIGNNDIYAVFNIADSILYRLSGGTYIVNTPGCPGLPNPNYPWDTATCTSTIGNQDIYAVWYVLHEIDSLLIVNPPTPVPHGAPPFMAYFFSKTQIDSMPYYWNKDSNIIVISNGGGFKASGTNFWRDKNGVQQWAIDTGEIFARYSFIRGSAVNPFGRAGNLIFEENNVLAGYPNTNIATAEQWQQQVYNEDFIFRDGLADYYVLLHNSEIDTLATLAYARSRGIMKAGTPGTYNIVTTNIYGQVTNGYDTVYAPGNNITFTRSHDTIYISTASGGNISGALTADYVPYATGAHTIANTGLYYNGTDYLFGTTSVDDFVTINAPANNGLAVTYNNVQTAELATNSSDNGMMVLSNFGGGNGVDLQSTGVSYFTGGQLCVGTTSPVDLFTISANNSDGIVLEHSGGTSVELENDGSGNGRLRLFSGSGSTVAIQQDGSGFSYFNGGNVGFGSNADDGSGNQVQVTGGAEVATGHMTVTQLTVYASNTAAKAAGLQVGGLYLYVLATMDTVVKAVH